MDQYFLGDVLRASTEVIVILISLSNVGTRVIQCLRLLLGDKEADDFKQKVYGMVASRIMLIDEVAKRYWAKA